MADHGHHQQNKYGEHERKPRHSNTKARPSRSSCQQPRVSFDHTLEQQIPSRRLNAWVTPSKSQKPCRVASMTSASCSRPDVQAADHSLTTMLFSSSLCCCTAELLSSRERPSSVRRPLINPFSQKPSSKLIPNVGRIYQSTTSQNTFFVSKNFNFLIFLNFKFLIFDCFR